jgi:hypothetical protein
MSDYEIFKNFNKAFNRPAFKGPSGWHSDVEGFKQAINDTIFTLNTGIRRSRSGVIIEKGGSKTDITNREWRQKMNDIENSLSKIISIMKDQDPYYPQTKGSLVDNTRDEIIKILNPIFEALKLDTLPIPTEVKGSSDVWRGKEDWVEE